MNNCCINFIVNCYFNKLDMSEQNSWDFCPECGNKLREKNNE